MEKNKKFYNKNNKNNYYKKNNHESKKVTYDSLMHANTITEIKEEDNNDFNKLLIMKYIAVSVILFVIIIGSIILFRAG